MGRKLGEHGGDNEKSARQCAASALLLAALLGLLMLAAGLFLLSPLLTLLGAEADVLPHAIPYARALLFASPFSCTGLVLSSLLRAQGKTPANMLAYLVSGAAGAVLGFALIVRQGPGKLKFPGTLESKGKPLKMFRYQSVEKSTSKQRKKCHKCKNV